MRSVPLLEASPADLGLPRWDFPLSSSCRHSSPALRLLALPRWHAPARSKNASFSTAPPNGRWGTSDRLNDHGGAWRPRNQSAVTVTSGSRPFQVPQSSRCRALRAERQLLHGATDSGGQGLPDPCLRSPHINACRTLGQCRTTLGKSARSGAPATRSHSLGPRAERPLPPATIGSTRPRSGNPSRSARRRHADEQVSRGEGRKPTELRLPASSPACRSTLLLDPPADQPLVPLNTAKLRRRK
jgi:hypothetical protein